LVFLTGKREIQDMCALLREELDPRKTRGRGREQGRGGIQGSGSGDMKRKEDTVEDEGSDSEEEITDEAAKDRAKAELLEFQTSGEELPLTTRILPLYSSLPVDQQMQVFAKPGGVFRTAVSSASSLCRVVPYH
jgi:HrpA-like RNA helicase